MADFDEKRKRDPNDRAAVDELRRYVEERGGSLTECDGDPLYFSDPDANYCIGWNGDYVAYFRCVKGDLPVPLGVLEKLKHLRDVRIDSAYRSDLSWLGSLGGLTNIYLDMPEKEDRLPSSWRCADTLQELFLYYYDSSSRHVPDSIRGLAGLRILGVRNFAEITPVILPDWLGDFPKLKMLLLDGSFSLIPYSVVRTGLPFTTDQEAERGVILDGVKLTEQDVSLFLSNDRTLIEAYYQGEQAGEDAALRECKVIFLGDGGAGKTSLIKRMKENTFRLGEKTTEGVRIIPWETELDGEPFRLRFMDFGGQEIMHSMHRCFLSGHTVYVVVCSVRDDIALETDAVRWLEQIKSYAPDCPVILALNKADENPNIAVNETALTERYPNLKAVLKTSAAAEEGSQYYAGFLCEEIKKQCLPCVQDWRGNKAMLDVKRALETMEKNYITAEDYRKLCAENGVAREDLQNALLGWFRDLGVAYFYRRPSFDRALESLRVLNPAWLTNGIYRLILRTDLQGKNGVLSHDDIRAILGKPFKGDASDTVYSAEETEFILHVMRIFQISHEIRDTGRELIPMLLPKETPKSAKNHKQDALRLRWEGAFLPNNLIHRLMIQKFEELDLAFMWRTGARFEAPSGGCIALAEMPDDKSLDVYVTGGNADARRVYMQSFQNRAEDILKSLNLFDATKKYLCRTVNGKNGKIPYEALLFAWEHGDKQFLIQDIQEYASVTELLSMVDPDTKHWNDKVFPAKRDAPTEKESADIWNTNLKNILLVFAIVLALILLAKGADLFELLKLIG